MPDLPSIVARLRAAGCVFAEDEANLLVGAADSPADLERLVAERASGLPLEQVVGWAMFCGQRVVVERGVFVPRWRSQFLVACAVRLTPPGALVVDLCCGTGALAVAVAAAVPEVEVHAADLHPAAVHNARRNLPGDVHEGDLFDALPHGLRGRVATLLVNTPYVPSGEVDLLPAEARLYEPLLALDGGPDGLDVQRRVAAEAGEWLAPGGHLLVEVSEAQAATSVALFTAHGLQAWSEHDDDLDATVVIARRG